MPVRNPSYNLPPFPPTGDANIDRALNSWRADFGGLYQRNLFEAERIPTAYTTARANVYELTGSFTTYIGLRVGLQGGEQVVVFGNLACNSRDGEQVRGELLVTFPNGDQTALTSAPIELNAGAGTTIGATIGNTWNPSPRIQQGGLHSFDIRVRRVTTSAGSTSTIGAGNLTVFLL